MNVHILFPFRQDPWGGANQFLHTLRNQLRQQGSYHNNPGNADALIVNLNPGNLLSLLEQIPRIKSHYPDKFIIARIDGPISLIRGHDNKLDRLLGKFIDIFADGVIYQSHWSKEANNKLAPTKPPYETVIHNAADPSIFYCRQGKHLTKTRLIATSWSPNIRKGFAIYQYLDQHLDFSRYGMTFVGNSPIAFKNITCVKPIPSQKLAPLLRQHDIYITASQNDPCSNALIEALSCGLPAVALAEAGHPELIQHGGELFTSQDDIIPKINLVAQNLPAYQANLPQFSITEAAQSYLNFARKINSDIQQDTYHPKRATPLITQIKTARIKALYYLHISPGLQFPQMTI